MNPIYYSLFKSKTLNPTNLRFNILEQYPTNQPDKELNFDQLLYILDQKCHNNKSDRDIGR